MKILVDLTMQRQLVQRNQNNANTNANVSKLSIHKNDPRTLRTFPKSRLNGKINDITSSHFIKLMTNKIAQ
jgi:hypothetical protein